MPVAATPKKKEKKLTKTSPGYGIALFDSIDFINADHWNKVLEGKNIFLSINYLRAQETSPPTNMRFRYALMYDGKKPMAIAYFQVILLTGESVGSAVKPVDDNDHKNCFREHIVKFLKKKSDKISITVLICGNAFASGENGFHYAEGTDPAEAFKALADTIYRIRKAEKLNGKVSTVLVKDFYDTTLPQSDILKKYKYRGFKVEPNMALDVNSNWGSFEGYLGSMTSKYRTRAKSILKKGTDLRRVDMDVKEIIKYSDRIEELYDAVHYKANFRLASFIKSYFWEMKNHLPDHYFLAGYFLDNKMMGFRTTFINNNFTEAHFIGLDYSINREYELYQNIIYDYVKEGITLGVQEVHLGRTASEIKSTLGATPHDLTCYVRRSNPLSNKIMKPFIELFKPTEWEPRNPFK